MRGFELPRNLVEESARYDEAGSPRRVWMAELPSIVDGLARRWSLDLGPAFQPGGVASWVAPARDRAGARVVLKVGWCHDEALHEADGLRAWDGEGAVRLLDSERCGDTSALLLEACEPGTMLATALPPLEQDEVVAGLLRRLWIEPGDGHPFRPLASMCDYWADEFEQKYAGASTCADLIDPGLARAGMELFRALPRDAPRGVLLPTDLHPENVLASAREPWLMIDPKPYLGDPTYDALQHVLNHPTRLRADPGGFAARMAGLLDLDAERLRHWLFARCVQESVDQPELGEVAVTLAP